MPLLLTALRNQQVGSHDVTICFFLDGCSDGSGALLRGSATDFPHRLHIAASPSGRSPDAGRARRAAMAMVLDGQHIHEDAVLLTTDADSVPANDWIVASHQALCKADVAAGTLHSTTPDARQTRVEAYYDRLHRYRRAVDPVPWDGGEGRHFSGGANLAIRSSTYKEIGGFRELACGEDAALLDDAARAGFRVRRDPAMVVETSSRREGRAPGGLAACLAEMDRSGLPHVAHPAGAAWQYRTQACARAAFARLDDEESRLRLGNLLGLTGDHVLGVARDCPNAEAFAMRVVPSAPDGERRVPLAEAEEALARLEVGARRGAA